MRYYTFSDLNTHRRGYWRRRRASGRSAWDHSILFFESDPDAPPIEEEEAVSAAYEIFGGKDAVEQALVVLPWSRTYNPGDADGEYTLTGWAVSACTRLEPPVRSIRADSEEARERVVLWHRDLREEVVPYEHFSVCTESHALMGRCPCPLATSYGDGSFNELTECVKTNLAPAFQLIPANAILKQKLSTDEWYRSGATPKAVQGFEYVSGVFLADVKGWVTSELPLGEIDPTMIEERREDLSTRSKQAARTRAAVKASCGTCAMSGVCDQGSQVHRCGGTRTPEMLTAALARYQQQYDIRRMVEGRFTEEQVTFLMRMGRSGVAGRTDHIRTRSKEVVLGAFIPKQWYRGQGYRFRVFADAREYTRHTDFESWDDLVTTLPSVQEMFDTQKEYIKPLPERVHLLYALVADRFNVERGGFGSVRYLYGMSAADDCVRFSYAAARWRESSRMWGTELSDARLVRDAYGYATNPEIVGK